MTDGVESTTLFKEAWLLCVQGVPSVFFSTAGFSQSEYGDVVVVVVIAYSPRQMASNPRHCARRRVVRAGSSISLFFDCWFQPVRNPVDFCTRVETARRIIALCVRRHVCACVCAGDFVPFVFVFDCCF